MGIRKRSPLVVKTTEAHLCTISTRLMILGQVPFFQNLPPEDLEWINTLFHEVDYALDQVICLSGDPAENIFVVADGRVRLLRHSMAGREILLNLLTPGEFFGAITGLGTERYPDTAQAHSPCCILVIDKGSFQHVLEQLPAVAIKLFEIMASRLQEANARLQQLSSLPVEGRIASLLLMLAVKFDEKRSVGLLLQVPLSREDMAGMIGTTTESASRVMSQFQKDGLIRSGRGWVAITDMQGLTAVADRDTLSMN